MNARVLLQLSFFFFLFLSDPVTVVYLLPKHVIVNMHAKTSQLNATKTRVRGIFACCRQASCSTANMFMRMKNQLLWLNFNYSKVHWQYLQIFKNWKFHMAQFKAKKSSSSFKHPTNTQRQIRNLRKRHRQKEIESGGEMENGNLTRILHVKMNNGLAC